TPHRVPFGAGLPDPACLQPAPHSLPIRVTGVPASIERPWLIGHPFAPLGLLAGREGFALATNAGLFIVLTLLELGEEAGLLALGPALVGVEPQQAGGLAPSGTADRHPVRGSPARSPPVDGRGVRLVHRSPRRPLRDLGRHRPAG